MVAPRPEEGGWEGHLASRGSVHEQRGGAVGGARRKDSGQPTPPGPSDTFWGTGGAEAHSSEHGVDGKGREGKGRCGRSGPGDSPGPLPIPKLL